MKTPYIFIFIFSFISIINLKSQSNPSFTYRIKQQGIIFRDTIASKYAPTPTVQNCTVDDIKKIGNNLYDFRVTSAPNFVGDAKIVFQYIENPLKIRFATFIISYKSSVLTVSPDFVSFTEDQEVVSILPLANDHSTAGGLVLTNLGLVTNGSATISGDSIHFIPNSGTKNAQIIYSLVDSLGAIGRGVVNVILDDIQSPQIDTIYFSIKNTISQPFYLPFEGFVLTNADDIQLGSVIQSDAQLFTFVPNKNAVGKEYLVFTDDLDNSRVIVIDIFNLTQNNSSIVDDIFYTAKNTPITFDVFANDLSSNFPINQYSNSLVHETLGVFTYTPPAGFSGEKTFTYRVNYGGGNTYTGKITIIVGNQQPQMDIDYHFTTLRNQPIVFEYERPIDDYSFTLADQADFGTLEIHNNSDTFNIDCNIITAKSSLVYTPDPGYYGQDEFSINYCVENNLCVTYKVYITILETEADSSCQCIGKTCIWPGDLNADGRVSIYDVLALGRYIGLSGPSRSDTQTAWLGSNTEDWSLTQANGVNIKHVDGNGDGYISIADTSSIANNYLNLHNFVPTEVLGIKDYPFYFVPNTTEVDSGDLLILDVIIGTSENPVFDVYGLAFGLDIAPQFYDSTSLSAHFYKNNWFSMYRPSIQMVKQPQDGRLQMAFTQVGNIVDDEIEGLRPIGSTGYGSIGQIAFIVDDEIEGLKSENNAKTYRLASEGIILEDVDGKQFSLPNTFLDIKVRNRKPAEPTEDKLLVFPNPTVNGINLHFNGNNIIKGYTLTNSFGQTLATLRNMEVQQTFINTVGMASGVYVLQVNTTQGIITKKVNIISEQ